LDSTAVYVLYTKGGIISRSIPTAIIILNSGMSKMALQAKAPLAPTNKWNELEKNVVQVLVR
jgi:hypothetical protein